MGPAGPLRGLRLVPARADGLAFRRPPGFESSFVPRSPQRRRRVLTKLRGYLALTIVCLGLVVLDPVQRLVVVPLARLRPARRIAILTRWQKFMAWWVTWWIDWLGGAELPDVPEIPGEAGTLVLMNHQSVLDIPIVVTAVRGTFPRIVTRRRYARWIPLISHMVRLYQYPVVDPAANAGESRKSLRSLRDAARSSDVPIAIFPEGSRTRDGEIRSFRKRGVRVVLKQRPWTVYVLVVDGFWERAKVRDFLGGMSAIRGRIRLVGPIAWDDPHGDGDAFLDEIRGLMVATLAEMRAAAPA